MKDKNEPYDYYLQYSTPEDTYGHAVDTTWERKDGTMWVSNGEYTSQVNYCPITGKKAVKQVEELKIYERYEQN